MAALKSGRSICQAADVWGTENLCLFSVSNTVCRGCCACVGDALAGLSPVLCGWHVCFSVNLYRALAGEREGMDVVSLAFLL